MERPWEPEQTVDAAQARRLIGRQFPALAGLSAEPYGIGWDNTAFLVGGRWVFRFPRRAIAAPLLAAESTILPALAPRLPLPIPVPVHLGCPDGDYPWPFAGYLQLDGTTACRADLDAAQRRAAAPQLAAFLAALHAVPTEEARRWGAAPDQLARVDVAGRMPRLEARLARIAALGLVGDLRPWRQILEAAPTDWKPATGTLCHGDLYARHLLVDGAGRPCGVIDWGDVHLGDAAVDLALAAGFLPPAAHDGFRAAYAERRGVIDDATWRVARFRALSSALAILVYGHDVGDAALLREGRIALGYLASAA